MDDYMKRSEDIPGGLDFAKMGGLMPAIVQDSDNGDVLMLAYMSSESFELTKKTCRATFWSRKRNEVWEKGATSGNYLYVQEMYTDCDGDAILLKVRPAGPVCHTGNKTCFYRSLPKQIP